ncbi:transporter substrate-binding domain-containing protein [Marinibactrum halimedae]|uniref:transporter substrate-binding domain-containing protein n=1 Tax=Marinibactrum halimedae TaxID=1444977 RepID=UPI001E5D4132|nr:transporter substrate-binding domain-containing protein [Marinibactrum halimedae]MCD9461091.1 transporter substrate-binding domain-containing protein [Marinibactrum halimedae]
MFYNYIKCVKKIAEQWKVTLVKVAVLLFVVYLFLYCSLSVGQVTIYGIEISGLHQKNGEGIYDKIIHEAVVRPEKVSIIVNPLSRARHFFQKCDNCCISPSNLSYEAENFSSDGLLQTQPFNLAKAYVFVKPGQPAVSRLTDLQGKRVGVSHGMFYGTAFAQAALSTEAVQKVEQNIKKLQQGRIDVFIAYVPDVYFAFQNLQIEPYPHDVSMPIVTQQESLVCRGVVPEFIENFNEKIEYLKSVGRIEIFD